MTGVAAAPPLCGPAGGAVASPSPAKPAAANAELIAWLATRFKPLLARVEDMAEFLIDVEAEIPEPTCPQIDSILRDIAEPRKRADQLVRRGFDPEVDHSGEFEDFANAVDSALWGAPDELEALRHANAQLRDGVHHLGSYCHDAGRLLSEIADFLRDSGSDRHGEDAAKTAAECEASQSGGASRIAPTPHSQCSKPREDK